MCGLLKIQITDYERNIKNSSFLGLFVTDTNSEWVKPRAEVQTQRMDLWPQAGKGRVG